MSKNTGIYQTCFDEIENIRSVLAINYDRCNQLSSLNFQIIAITAAIIIGVVSLLGTSYFSSIDPSKNWTIIVIINSICAVLIFWRYAANVINNRIVRSYGKIIYCENRLDIPYEISLIRELEIETEYSLQRKNEVSKELYRHEKYSNLDYPSRTLIVQKLINGSKFGNYFYDFFDKIVSFLVIGLIIFEFWFAFEFSKIITADLKLFFDGYFVLLFITLPIIFVFSVYGLIVEIPGGFTIQRIPTEKDIDDIISQPLTKSNN